MVEWEDTSGMLDSIGWRKSEPTSKDTRVLHVIAPTERLKNTYAQREKEKEMKRMENKPKKFSQGVSNRSNIRKMETSFLKRVLDAASLSAESEEARATLLEEDSELLGKMEDTKLSVDSRRFHRNEELNKQGIFSKPVNALRANSLYRVELRRRMQPNLLRRRDLENVEPGEQQESLEQKLQHLIDNISALDSFDPSQPTNAHYNHRSNDMDGLNHDMAKATVAAAAAKKANKNSEEVEARRREAAAAVQGMLGRYRAAVEARREQLLEDQGLDMIDTIQTENSLTSQETASKYRKAIVQGTKKERTEAEEALSGKYKSYEPASTHTLVSKALSRVTTVMARIAEQEALLKKQAELEAAQAEAEAAAQAQAEARAAAQAARELEGRCKRISKRVSKKMILLNTLPNSNETSNRASAQKTAIEKAREGKSRGSSQGSKASDSEPIPPMSGQQLMEMAKNRQYDGIPPRLPDLVLDEGLSLAEQLQKRLERIWIILQLPVLHKLDMVIKYTSKDMSSHLEAALGVWEGGAAAILAREAALSTLGELQAQINSYLVKGLPLPQAIEDEERFTLAALENSTVFVLKADVRLQVEFKDILTYNGVPYAEQKHDPQWWSGSLELDVLSPLK